jgi:hypothetical protein
MINRRSWMDRTCNITLSESRESSAESISPSIRVCSAMPVAFACMDAVMVHTSVLKFAVVPNGRIYIYEYGKCFVLFFEWSKLFFVLNDVSNRPFTSASVSYRVVAFCSRGNGQFYREILSSKQPKRKHKSIVTYKNQFDSSVCNYP